MALAWNNSKIKSFRDEMGTEFIRGPFEIDGIAYDYKLRDKDGEDYCSIKQMEEWGVELNKIISSEQ